jgi:GNAT superfamily N-acetyltransferase
VTGLRIERLARAHALDAFDCGTPTLNRFLVRHALASQQADAAATYVGLADDVVVGFHTLVVSEVSFDAAPARLAKGLPRHPVPLMLLARLAVHRDWQGRGLGAGLLKDALRRTANWQALVAGACHFSPSHGCSEQQSVSKVTLVTSAASD